MKELVTFIAESLVDHPESVRVDEVEGRGATILELRVASSDMGRVIGKGGRVVNAMRTLVEVAADRQGRDVVLEVVD
ncbi:MAG: KH domain-containing protein [Candidatus Promineifilaceae bacterium]|nr:KH domain-containing protein [Candidatus Promineifilaceae bacterium]